MTKIELQKKLEKYRDYIKKNGWGSTELNIYLREKADSVKTFTSGDKIIIPEALNDFLPMGNPPPYFFGYGYDNNTGYVTLFHTQDTAINVKFTMDMKSDFTHPLFLSEFLNESVEKILVATRDDLELNTDYTQYEQIYDYSIFSGFKNLDSLIYSFLSRRKILFLGSRDLAIQYFVHLLNLIPKDKHRYYGFSINLPHNSDNSIILASYQQINQKEEIIDEFLNHDYTVINPISRECFGEFTSDFVEKLAEMISNNQIKDAQEVISSILEKASQINGEEDTITVAEKLDTSYIDADLIIDVQNRLLKQEVN